MSTDERIRRRASFRRPMMILGAMMTIIYIVLGAWLLIDRDFLSHIPDELRYVFAAMLLIYGGYRGWRIFADLRAS